LQLNFIQILVPVESGMREQTPVLNILKNGAGHVPLVAVSRPSIYPVSDELNDRFW
jgi:hypothetical protein